MFCGVFLTEWKIITELIQLHLQLITEFLPCLNTTVPAWALQEHV